MVHTLTTLDPQILLWVQQHMRGDVATMFWESMTDIGNLGLIWMFISLFLFVRKKTRITGTTAFLAIFMDLVVSNGILKPLIARPRPFLAYTDIVPIISPPADFSFPSGHTAIAFAVAFVIFEMMPKRYGIPALFLAVLIGLSRLYLGVHYPTDVLGGILIGCLVAKTAVWLIGKCAARKEISA